MDAVLRGVIGTEHKLGVILGQLAMISKAPSEQRQPTNLLYSTGRLMTCGKAGIAPTISPHSPITIRTAFLRVVPIPL
ncbi:MAG: hypothetical protein C4337_10440 [Armatimonadota bacterium]